MTDEVAALVLEDNRLQALALSIAEQGGPQAVASQLRLIETLEDGGDLDRRTEGLADGDALARRATDGHGLTRPELAVLLSSAKLVLQAAIEASDLAGDDEAEPLLRRRVPRSDAGAVPQAHPRAPAAHARSSRPSSPTRSSTGWAWSTRSSWPRRKAPGSTGSPAAFVGACRLLGMDAIWQAIETARMPETARLQLFERAASALRGHMADLLRAGGAMQRPSQLIGEVAAGRRRAGRPRRRPARRRSARPRPGDRRRAGRDRRAAEGRRDGRQAVRGRRRDRPRAAGRATPASRRCG